MQEEMQLLQELQALDVERHALEQQRGKYVAELEELQSGLNRVQEMVDSLAGEMAELQAERLELAKALTQEQENVKRSESRLPQIKTQKEYVAVLKEVDTAKKLAKELQDQIDAKDQSLGTLGSDKEEKETELQGLDEQASARRSEVDASKSEIEGSLEQMKSQRDGLLKQLPTPLRKRYELLLARRAGLAVVEAKNGACMGCHMHLPPQLYNSLFVATEVQACPHCNRLLFVAEPG